MCLILNCFAAPLGPLGDVDAEPQRPAEMPCQWGFGFLGERTDFSSERRDYTPSKENQGTNEPTKQHRQTGLYFERSRIQSKEALGNSLVITPDRFCRWVGILTFCTPDLVSRMHQLQRFNPLTPHPTFYVYIYILQRKKSPNQVLIPIIIKTLIVGWKQ